ncbi:MAG: hypothetical protein IPO08_16810 [Xanthomonadales bacterium]|nr:hypothetical protein [Xanthomonadales bacterium]
MRNAPTQVTDSISGRSYPFLDCINALGQLIAVPDQVFARLRVACGAPRRLLRQVATGVRKEGRRPRSRVERDGSAFTFL